MPATPLFNSWDEVAARLRHAKSLLLLLDFDGTLVGFHRNPRDVQLDDTTRKLLGRLARRRGVTLGFISGRRRDDLRRRANVEGAQYWGLHGWEAFPGVRLNGSSRRKLLLAKRGLEAKIRHLAGVWLQDKHAALVLHYRGAPLRSARQAQAAFRKVVAGLRASFCILRGKKIWELLPPEVEGKGAVAGRLAGKAPKGTLAIYVGDDTTDEAAFAALPRGLTIRVGRTSRTRAQFRLKNIEEVKLFLQRVEVETRNQKLGLGNRTRN